MSETFGFDAKRFEQLFDQFVKDRTEGRRLDDRARNVKCADYFFPNDGVIVELKTLNEDHGDREFTVRLLREAAANLGHQAAVIETWRHGLGPLPLDVRKVVDSKVQNSIKRMVRKANDQIKSTRTILGKKHDSVLIVANLGERLFGPVELLRNIVGHALGRSTLSIDAILLITSGVTYSDGSRLPQHYISPVYAEGKTYLGDFIEPLVGKWVEFEASALGLRPEIEVVRELDSSSLYARPIL
jgi:hypothetical protein